MSQVYHLQSRNCDSLRVAKLLEIYQQVQAPVSEEGEFPFFSYMEVLW